MKTLPRPCYTKVNKVSGTITYAFAGERATKVVQWHDALDIIVASPNLLAACKAALAFVDSTIEYKEMMGYSIAEDTLEIQTQLRDIVAEATL